MIYIPIKTRYLYQKQLVESSLISSILFPDILDKRDDAYFWAYELYYSGFYKSLSVILWNIYYDFYAMNCPFLEKYFKQYIIYIESRPKLVGFFIDNLLLYRKRATLDVYILRQINERYTMDTLGDLMEECKKSRIDYLKLTEQIYKLKEQEIGKIISGDILKLNLNLIDNLMIDLPLNYISKYKIMMAIMLYYIKYEKVGEKVGEKAKIKKKNIIKKSFCGLELYKTIEKNEKIRNYRRNC